jgi:hypothetical protein
MTLSTSRLSLRFLLLVIAVVQIGRAEDPIGIEALKKGQPKDVAVFISRAFNCWHFAGEEPYSEERKQEILAALDKYKCNRLASDESRLRKKYRRNSNVLKALDATKEWQ